MLRLIWVASEPIDRDAAWLRWNPASLLAHTTAGRARPPGPSQRRAVAVGIRGRNSVRARASPVHFQRARRAPARASRKRYRRSEATLVRELSAHAVVPLRSATCQG